MNLLCRALTPALLFLALPLAAQTRYPVDKITIAGGAPYTDAEILATANFQTGQVLTRDTLATPAQHLLDTGMFDAAEMQLVGPGNRTAHLDLKPIPPERLMPASFQNFVLWTPQELSEGIHKLVPLYRGYCLDAGNLPDLIDAALTQLTIDKGLKATVQHTIVEATTAHPQRMFQFSMDPPTVVLRTVELNGVPPGLVTPGLQNYIRRMGNTAYNEGLSGGSIEDRLLAPFRALGYLDAALANVERIPSNTADGISVEYKTSLTTGDVYKVSAISYDPEPLYSAAQFEHDVRLHVGDIASTNVMAEQEAAIRHAYEVKGYAFAYVARTLTRNATTHTVAYATHVVPGDVYTLRTMKAANLPAKLQPAFDALWKMKVGDVYDSSYFDRFMKANGGAGQGPLAGTTATYEVQPDSQAHVVDMTVTFIAVAGR